jgi:hypothetical protein
VVKLVDLYTKGWLPYTLRWQFRVTESRSPYGFTIEALGDFVGRGIWTFAQDGPQGRGHLLEDPCRETAAAPTHLPAQTDLRGQPPVGDGPGRGEPAPRARASPRRDARGAGPWAGSAAW